MSSVLSTWFYVLTLGIALLLFVALVFIFFKPDMFLQLTSASGQLVDLTGMDNFLPGNIPGTAASAVIKVGANSYVIANDFTPTSPIPNSFVAPLPGGATGKAAATDVAGAKVTGTFMFWLLMLGIGFLTLLLAFIAVKYPAKLFGPQISALVGCLPKTKSPCSSSSSSCSAPAAGSCAGSTVTTTPPTPTLPSAPVTPAPPPQPPVIVKPATPPPAPKPAVPTSGFTPAQLAVLQQIMAAMATAKPTAPVA